MSVEIVLVNGRRFCNVTQVGDPIELGDAITVDDAVAEKLLEGMTLDKRGNDVPRFLKTSDKAEIHKYLPGWPEGEEVEEQTPARRQARRRSTAGSK